MPNRPPVNVVAPKARPAAPVPVAAPAAEVEYPASKSKAGLIAVIVVLLAVAGAAGAYFGGVIPALRAAPSSRAINRPGARRARPCRAGCRGRPCSFNSRRKWKASFARWVPETRTPLPVVIGVAPQRVFEISVPGDRLTS